MIFHGASITFGLPSQIVYSVSFLIAFTELYSISENIKVITGVNLATNLLLSTFTNQISFTFNGIKYDLYKYSDGKFATVDGEVKLIKIE
jgi:hypothetical protein